jgi:hypothetical protein
LTLQAAAPKAPAMNMPSATEEGGDLIGTMGKKY